MPSSISTSSTPTSIPPTPTPTSTPTLTSAPTSSPDGLPPPTTHSSGINRGVIAGSATAGGVIFLVLVALAIVHCRRWKAYRAPATESPRNISELKFHRVDKSLDGTAASAVGTTTTSGFPTMADSTTPARLYGGPQKAVAPSPPTSPARSALRPLPRTPSQNQLRQAGAHDEQQQQQHVDINALAMEVASVLLHTPPRPGSRQHLNDPRYESGSSNETNATAPPHYRPS
ncbi:hypothetical protein FB451DRAFT_282287 [Mycena latifolia]|nr:hypothetical protein FB451DRAFT_282287 [Mycena latifolia]